ncbi:tetratricopeptide repeat protein [Marinimicrobium sp. ARAG 43.8]|uniref:tetratricopeptide repeat protein n=1 Tax=Marinimicrobium sp. ARAG 43.8 TaxID=3418719 RepID=UPI003CEE823C
MKPLVVATLCSALGLATPLLQAQVRVVESQPSGSSQGGQQGAGSQNDNANMQAELFYQLQALQQEVLELRGLVEEQSNELRRLKQKRMEDYLDLDRRIGELTKGGSQSANLAGAGGLSLGAGSGSDDDSSGGDERASETEMYRDAYQLLRDREIDQSIEAFNAYLEAHPRGNFAGNSYYWLGEIYLLKGELGEAQKWFEQLLETFPKDRKRPDAQYKLGRVYHQQGKNDQARRLLEEVASSGSDAARLARQYLQENL